MSPLARLPSALVLVALALLVTAAASQGLEGDELVQLCTGALVIELWLAVVALASALLAAPRPLASLGLGAGRLSTGSVLLLALGTLAASHALDGLLDLSGLSDQSVLGEMPRLLEGVRGSRLALALLALGVAPAIGEELLCRGLVQRGLTRRFGAGVGLPAAALLFGALHVEPIHAAFATILGLYLGLVAHWSGGIRAAILCHGLNNLAAVLLAAGIGDAPWASGTSVVAGSAVALGCLWEVRRRLPPGREPGIGPRDLQPSPHSSDR